MRKLPITKTELEKVYSKNSIGKIAKRYFCSYAAVYKRLKKFDIQIYTSYKGQKKLNGNDVKNIIKLYKNEWSLVEIGEKYKVNNQTVKRLLIKNGLKIRSRQEAQNTPRFKEKCSDYLKDRRLHGKWFGLKSPLGQYRVLSHGYIVIKKPEHPFANNNGYIAEHRIVAERLLGRMLKPTEFIHHINHNKMDNSPYNLYLCKNEAEHRSLHTQKIMENPPWSNLL